MSFWDDVPPANERQGETRGGVPVDRILWDVDSVEVDDPEALAAAEAAVRGEDSPVIPIDTGEPALPKGWRALVGWPRLEDQRHKTLAYIGLGSNLGDRAANLAAALRAIGEIPDTEGLGVSRAYESEPWGGIEQPAYANAVAVVSTDMRADQLLEALNDIEDSLGRVRGERHGPRTIDLDILLFGDEEWQRADLTIPHPRLLERAFVVVPLLEVDPQVTMPDGTRITRTYATLGRITGVLGAIPGFGRSTVLLPRRPRASRSSSPAPSRRLARRRSPPRDAWVAIESGIQGMFTGRVARWRCRSTWAYSSRRYSRHDRSAADLRLTGRATLRHDRAHPPHGAARVRGRGPPDAPRGAGGGERDARGVDESLVWYKGGERDSLPEARRDQAEHLDAAGAAGADRCRGGVSRHHAERLIQEASVRYMTQSQADREAETRRLRGQAAARRMKAIGAQIGLTSSDTVSLLAKARAAEESRRDR